MLTSKISFTTFPPIAGILMIYSAIQYVVLEAVTASAWTNPTYNYATNFISDLGNPIPNDLFNNTVVNSPFHPLMNLAFVTQGMLFMAVAFLLWRRVPGWVRGLLLALALLHGVGIILVGTFHENSTVPLAMKVPHYLGAWGAIFGGNLIAVAVGLFGARVSASPLYRVVRVVIGVVGIVSFAWLLADPAMMATQGGLLERISVYTVVLWELMTGALLFVGWARQRRISPEAEALAVR